MSEARPRLKVLVNGAVRTVEIGCTLEALMGQLKLPDTGIAVAVNRSVVPRSASGSHRLHDGDSIEIIQAVGGG